MLKLLLEWWCQWSIASAKRSLSLSYPLYKYTSSTVARTSIRASPLPLPPGDWGRRRLQQGEDQQGTVVMATERHQTLQRRQWGEEGQLAVKHGHWLDPAGCDGFSAVQWGMVMAKALCFLMAHVALNIACMTCVTTLFNWNPCCLKQPLLNTFSLHHGDWVTGNKYWWWGDIWHDFNSRSIWDFQCYDSEYDWCDTEFDGVVLGFGTSIYCFSFWICTRHEICPTFVTTIPGGDFGESASCCYWLTLQQLPFCAESPSGMVAKNAGLAHLSIIQSFMSFSRGHIPFRQKGSTSLAEDENSRNMHIFAIQCWCSIMLQIENRTFFFVQLVYITR